MYYNANSNSNSKTVSSIGPPTDRRRIASNGDESHDDNGNDNKDDNDNNKNVDKIIVIIVV